MMRLSRYVITASCLCIVIPATVHGADDSSTGSGSNANSAASSTTAPAAQSSTKQLQGSVKQVDIEAAECLRQMGDSAKKMQRAMLELMGESTRMAYIAVGDPNVIGTLIIPALPVNMRAQGPYLPLRKKWIDYYLNQVGELIPIYAELVDSLVMPDSVKAQATVLLDQMRPLFSDAKFHYDELVYMAKNYKTVHNDKVAERAVMVHDDLEKMDKIRLAVFELLKKSEATK